MASDNEASCDGDPNFAVICGFLEKFGTACGLTNIDFLDLQEMLENTHEVAPTLIDLHIKLLRKLRKSVSTERWERAVINICHSYNTQDAWEIERFGYKKARIGSKLRLLKQLLEMQFDLNVKFKNEINKMSATELRTQPLGRDKMGHAYWFQADECCQIRVYKEDPDEETWALVAKDREGLVALINELGCNEVISSDSVTNDDSNSLEIEKPILDTGQSDPSSDSTKTSKKSSDAEGEGDIDEEETETNDEIRNPETNLNAPVAVNGSSEQKALLLSSNNNEDENKIINDKNVEEKQCDRLPKEEISRKNDNTNTNAKLQIESPKVIGSDVAIHIKKNVDSQNIVSTDTATTVGEQKIISESRVDAHPLKLVNPSKLGVNDAIEEINKPVETDTSVNVACKDEKPAILRLKPLTDLLSIHHESEKKVELSGIKEKYIRSDPPSQTSNRKAVDSAGFAEIYKAELKRPLDYSIEEPSILKRPRTDRPTLLGNKKIHKLYIPKEDEAEVDDEECEDYVGETIEEPLMLVTGKGNGNDNNSENITASPVVGEEIEEPLMYITGQGSGNECQAGNENEQEKTEEKNNSINNEDSSSTTAKNIIKTETICEPKQEKKENIRCPPKKTKWELSKSSSLEEGKANVQKLVDQWENTKRSEEEKPHEKSPPVKKSNFFFGPGSGFTFKSPPVSPVKASIGSTSVIESKPSQTEDNDKKETDISSDDNLSPPLNDGNVKGDVNKNVISEPINSSCYDKSITVSSGNKEVNIFSQSCDIESKNNPLNCIGSNIDGANINKISSKHNFSSKEPLDESVKKETSDEEMLEPKNGNILAEIQSQKSEERNGNANEAISNESQVKTSKIADDNEVSINSTENKLNKDSDKNVTVNTMDKESILKENLIFKTNDNNALEKEKNDYISKEFEVTKGIEEDSNKQNNSANETSSNIENNTSNIQENRKIKESEPVVQNNIESSKTEVKNITREIIRTSDKKDFSDKLKNVESSNEITSFTSLKANDNETVQKTKTTKKPQLSSEDDDIKKIKGEKSDCLKKGLENYSKKIENKLEPVIPRRSLRSGIAPEPLELKPRRRRRKKILEKPEQSNVETLSDLKVPNNQDLTNVLEKRKSPVSGDSNETIQVNQPIVQKQSKSKFSEIDMKKLENEVISNEEINSKTCKDSKNLTVQNIVLEKSQSEDTIVEEVCKQIKVSDCYVKTDKDEGNEDISELVDNLEKKEISEVKTDEKKMTIATLSLDFTEPASPSEVQEVIKRVTRKRGRGSPTPDNLNDDSKRRKRGRRPINKDLRRSVEEQKKKDISSSEEEKSGESDIKNKSKRNENAEYTNDAPQTPKKKKRKKKTMLGLDIPDNIHEEIAPTGVRQSRRIAQIKIKEEAERRKLEEMTLNEIKETHKKRSKKEEDKDYKAEKRKRNKIITEDETTNDIESDEKKKKKKRKRRKRKNPKFDETNPWKSSSDSSSESHADEDEDEVEYEDDNDSGSPLFKSDHEFSPESDIENDEAQPLKRARTVRKEDAIEEESIDDTNCQKCGKSDHPEWILLCDGCDSGWHCSCLRPALLNIPEGDWYCPPCQHVALVKSLQTQLIEFDKKLSKREIEVRRKERLAYVGISLDNVLPSKETDVLNKNKKRRTVQDSYDESASGESSLSGSTDSESSTSDSEDEPIYQLRQRRQAHSYRFNDYDELINSAIQDDVDSVQRSGAYVSKGKDIANIVAAEVDTEANMPEDLPPVVPVNTDLPVITTTAPEGSDEEIIRPVKKLIGKKKHRKLNSLDISSGDDDNSDEDFRGTSSDEDDDEDFDEDLGSESSESGNRRRRHKEPVRRSTRARVSRYDSDFINDDSDDDFPKRKKRTTWTESESEPESDRSWGRRKRTTKRKPPPSLKKKRTKKKRSQNDSDPDVYKKRKPKIKFGGLESEEEGGDSKRRTRGKKINYIDALGSDSEDEVRRRKTVVEDESEDEFVLNEEEDYPDEAERDSDDSNDGPHMVGAVIKSGSKKGKGKGGIKRIKRAQGEENELFPPLDPHLPEAKILPMTENDLETNPIEQINKNLEAMDEKEMEMMMEEEEYATRQLQMVAAQLEKEKRRKEMEARRLEAAAPVVVPPPVQISSVVTQLLPTTLDDKSPKKRGRKPKGTEIPEVQTITLPAYNTPHNIEKVDANELVDSNVTNLNSDGTPKKRRGREIPVTLDGAVKTSSPSDPSIIGGKLGIASAPQPFSQSQPKPATITRMLQAQPGQPPFPVGGVNMKYYADRPEGPSPPISGGNPPNSQYIPVTGPGINNYSPVRGSLPQAHRLRSPGPQNIPPHIYHSHHPMDPSPSGGGPIPVPERSSPALVSPSSSASPLSNKGDPTPPPPPYVRPPMQMVPQHLQQSRPPNLSYHPGMPANFHYSPYPPSEEATPPEQFQNVPPYPDQYQQEGPPEKNYDEENGEFGGLVSYFSSQREDDLDT